MKERELDQEVASLLGSIIIIGAIMVVLAVSFCIWWLS